MSVIEEIAAERARQVDVEGWPHEHDDCHSEGELGEAAATYLLAGTRRGYCTNILWPWYSFQRKVKSRRENLIRAAALVVAEIERIDRAAARTP